MTKKTLIELMLESDVKWPEGAEFAAQDKEVNTGDLRVQFYGCKPYRRKDKTYWADDNGTMLHEHSAKLPELCRNWHQTIVTKDQYLTAKATQPAKLNIVEQVVEASTPEKRTIEAIIANIKECDDKITHHSAELATYTEGREKFVGELNEILSMVGMKVVDAEPKAAESEWPDYCDENGVVVDWDGIRSGDKLKFIGFTNELHSHWEFTEGRIYTASPNPESGNSSPKSDDGIYPSKNWGFKFLLIK